MMKEYKDRLRDIQTQMMQASNHLFRFDIMSFPLIQFDEFSEDSQYLIERRIKNMCWMMNIAVKKNKQISEGKTVKLIPQPPKIDVNNNELMFVRSFAHQMTHADVQDEENQNNNHEPYKVSEYNKEVLISKLDLIRDEFTQFESLQQDEEARERLISAIEGFKEII